jgi:hypothetical protein
MTLILNLQVKDKLIRELQEEGCDAGEPKYQIL